MGYRQTIPCRRKWRGRESLRKLLGRPQAADAVGVGIFSRAWLSLSFCHGSVTVGIFAYCDALKSGLKSNR
jgi:hypothetical protein